MMCVDAPRLKRTTFTTSRLLDFCSEKELTAQIGHPVEDWPLVILKELVDNALDACEDARVSPQIEVLVRKDGITVSDNGPGIPASTIKGVLDFSIRVSNREAYVSPTRGAQGNALKTVVTMPFVLSGDAARGEATITAKGLRHQIAVSVDQLRQKPVVTHSRSELVRNGTSVHVEWPDSACSLLADAEPRFLQMAEDFAFLNPHLALTVKWMAKDAIRFEPTQPDWKKWRPSDPTSPYWYEVDNAVRLVAGYIAHDKDRGKDRTVREFVSEFRGLSSTVKQKKVLDATGFTRTNLSDLVNGDGVVRRKSVEALLEAMRLQSKPVKAPMLGILGEDHLKQRFAGLGCEMESFEYRKIPKTGADGLPIMVEAAFAWCGEERSRRLITGVNWSAAIQDPFRQLGKTGEGLDSILAEHRAGHYDPIAFLLHVACPRVKYTDRGKSAVVVNDAEDILKAVCAVTRRWEKQRRSEERNAARASRRRDVFTRSCRTTIKEVAWEIMADAYARVSNNGRLAAHARQMMYACRPTILERASREALKDEYFTQVLLPDYMTAHPEETVNWNIVFDARGHLYEPHTGREVALGTIDVREYLQEIKTHHILPFVPTFDGQAFPTCGPRHRYGAILFCEKEGFLPLFEQVHLAETYDIALMSSKGMSNTATRELVDRLCHDGQDGSGIKLFVLHDFDKYGFSIMATLKRATRRYRFANAVDVIDLGLRLADVEAYGLQAEPAPRTRSDATANLRDNDATQEEIAFLTGDGYSSRAQRVELNAFTSAQLLEWIESKLTKHGVEKVIPDGAAIETAYRRAVQKRCLNAELEKVTTQVAKRVEALPVKAGTVRTQVRRLLDNNATLSRDAAVARIAALAKLPAKATR
jgi:DNA topoisomerase VI subunit B